MIFINLNLFNNINRKDLKEDKKIDDFIEKLNNFLEKGTKKIEENLFETEDLGILKSIQKNRKTSMANKKIMAKKEDEILMQYAIETLNKGDLYFIVEKSKKEQDKYVVYKYEENEDTVITLSKEVLPENVKINEVLRLNNEEYTIDKQDTENVKIKIEQMANDLLNKQDKELQEYRINGHLYMISERINENIFIVDVTENKEFEVEEVDFPKNLLEDAKIGTIFQYENGQYKFYSNKGYDFVEKNKS